MDLSDVDTSKPSPDSGLQDMFVDFDRWTVRLSAVIDSKSCNGSREETSESISCECQITNKGNKWRENDVSEKQNGGFYEDLISIDYVVLKLVKKTGNRRLFYKYFASKL